MHACVYFHYRYIYIYRYRYKLMQLHAVKMYIKLKLMN